MTGIARGAGESGAENTISGAIPAFTHWAEDLYFRDADGEMSLTGLSFRLQFRQSADQTGADVTLSSTGSELSIVASTSGTSSILRISVASGTFSAWTQDMVADLVCIDSTGNTTLYAHGVVSFVNNPVTL